MARAGEVPEHGGLVDAGPLGERGGEGDGRGHDLPGAVRDELLVGLHVERDVRCGTGTGKGVGC